MAETPQGTPPQGTPPVGASDKSGQPPATEGTAGTAPVDPKAAPAPSDPAKHGEAGKPGEPGKPVVPEAYKLTMPEGVEVDAKLLEGVTPIFKDLGLTNEQAQKLSDVYAKHLSDTVKANEAAHAQQLEDWGKQSSEDKEIGGAKFKENVATAMKAVARFGTPELKALLETTGYGNHPEFVRFCMRIGAGISEDGVVRSADTSGARKSDVEVFYGASS